MSASSHKLRFSFGLGFLAFIVAGSLLLLAWLRQREREESARLFQALAQADAEFVQRMNLPRSEKLARDLGQLLGMQIEFRQAGSSPASSEDTWVVRLDEKNDMVFTRRPVASSLSMRDPATRNALIFFWLVSGLVGWILARERFKRAQSERLAMLGRVATSLAHDIKNPLASIQLHTQLMTPSDGEDAKAMKMIESESEVIAGLVNQWLYLANPLPPKRVKLDVTECVRIVARNLEAQAQHAGVVVDVQLPEPIWVMGDAARLSQAFRNIMVNAIQAMPSGGRLTIHARRQTSLKDFLKELALEDKQQFVRDMQSYPVPRQIPPEAEARKARLLASGYSHLFFLEFTDTGTGFSSHAIKHGSELFYTEKEGGMGLGLNIVDDILRAHEGKLHFFNNPKGGATVSVMLDAYSA